MTLNSVMKVSAPALLLAALVVAGCQPPPPGAPQPSETASAPTTAPVRQMPMAPDFTLETANGGRFTLSSMRGKHPVLINFFATW